MSKGLDSFSFKTNRVIPHNVSCLYDYATCKQLPTTTGTLSTWGMVGLFELVGLRGPGGVALTGKYTCGTSAAGLTAGFRAGWRASRPCDCSDAGSATRPGWLNCAGIPYA